MFKQHTLGLGFAPSWHRPFLRYLEGEQGAGGEAKPSEGGTFSQADVDRIVKDRLEQQARNKFGDYADLKAQAAGAKTLEDRMASLEGELSTTKEALTVTQIDAARVRVAASFGISTEKGPKGEPSDADLLLTGSDETTMTAQAERLAGRVADQKKNGNRAPKEGDTKQQKTGDQGLRDFTRNLFGNDD